MRDPVEANEIFIDLPEPVIAGLEQRGYAFYRWDGTVVRLVTAWNTDAGDVDRMIADARELALLRAENSPCGRPEQWVYSRPLAQRCPHRLEA